MGAGRHEVADDADPRVDDQPQRDRRLGADPAGQHPEEERERDADELHEHDRRDGHALVELQLGRVDAWPCA